MLRRCIYSQASRNFGQKNTKIYGLRFHLDGMQQIYQWGIQIDQRFPETTLNS